MHVRVVVFLRSANYAGQCRETRLSVFGSSIIPPGILPGNDHFLDLLPPVLCMDANEILGQFDRAREAHPKQHTCAHPGGARWSRPRLSRRGMADPPISPHEVPGGFASMVLRAEGKN